MALPSSMAWAIVAKLSSARTISAASLAASVHLRPMATPTSARFNAGASLTPSPVTSVTSPLACSASTRCRTTSRLRAALQRCPFASGPVTVTSLHLIVISNLLGHGDIIQNQCPRKPAPPQEALIAWSPVIILTQMWKELYQKSITSLSAREVNRCCHKVDLSGDCRPSQTI